MSEKKVKDPRHLLYHYPNLPAQRYAQLIAEFHNDEKRRAFQQIAKALGCLLVPSGYLHWRWKQEHADRRVQVGYESFYYVKRDEAERISRRSTKLQSFLSQPEPEIEEDEQEVG